LSPRAAQAWRGSAAPLPQAERLHVIATWTAANDNAPPARRSAAGRAAHFVLSLLAVALFVAAVCAFIGA
jgi:hypothetical protein